MKRLLLLLFLIPLTGYSQKITFCRNVDTYGHPQDQATEFVIPPGGGFFKVLVRLPKKLNSYEVVFDLYRLEENNKEVLDNSLRMKTLPSLLWFYKEITVYKAGDYIVYIFDERDKLLGVGKVKIIQG